jgi:hypothetical protein
MDCQQKIDKNLLFCFLFILFKGDIDIYYHPHSSRRYYHLYRPFYIISTTYR